MMKIHASILSLDDMWRIFLRTPRKKYQKVGRVKARLAIEGEEIETVIDGEKETQNTAGDDDVIVTNPGGEHYIIDREKFLSRYEGPKLTEHDNLYQPTGICWAFRYKGPPVSFKAPWGELMQLNKNDMLCSTGKDGMDANNKLDIYRIERKAFKTTYRRAS